MLSGQSKGAGALLPHRFYLTRRRMRASISTLVRRREGSVMLSILLSSDLNFLILDEPTNHLDIMSKHAVEVAPCHLCRDLPDNVTHDRYLLDSVCSRVAEFGTASDDVQRFVLLATGAARKGDGGGGRDIQGGVGLHRLWTSRKKYSAGEKVLIAPSERRPSNGRWTMASFAAFRARRER